MRRRLRGGARRRSGLGGQHRGHREDSGHDLDGLLGRLAQRFEARPALGLDLDREADIALADDHARHHAEGDDHPMSSISTSMTVAATCTYIYPQDAADITDSPDDDVLYTLTLGPHKST